MKQKEEKNKLFYCNLRFISYTKKKFFSTYIKKLKGGSYILNTL
jgi:hypothetical protein